MAYYSNEKSIAVDGIVKDPDSIRSGDPYSESGSGYRGAKVTHKNKIK
jgi:hypothetical protein